MNTEIYKLAEKQFLNMIKGHHIVHDNKLNSCYYYIETDVIFNHRTNSIWIAYKSIWSFFEIGFGFTYTECYDFFMDMVKQHLGLVVESVYLWNR
jgi:hypothetical protein